MPGSIAGEGTLVGWAVDCEERGGERVRAGSVGAARCGGAKSAAAKFAAGKLEAGVSLAGSSQACKPRGAPEA